jgi:arginase
VKIGVIGVPTSAAAFAPGQEQAPQALRDADLLGALRRAGVEVHDRGDSAIWRWRPDRAHPRAQNVGAIVEIVHQTSRRVQEAIADGEITIVLGGDCTVGVGTVCGHVAAGERIGLLYFDTHADLNVPGAVPEGALDWMGMAHMLGVPGAVIELVTAGSRVPLLDAEQVLVFAWGPEQATAFERDLLDQRAIARIPVDEVAANPEGAARRALELIEDRCDHVLIHFDVDVIDFTDVPLSENWGRNEGLSFEDAMRALRCLLDTPKLGALTITELNPDHTEEGAGTIESFAATVAQGLADCKANDAGRP